MGGSSKSQTVGYKYYAGLHLVFCHAIDKLLRIDIGDKTAWTGSVTGNTAIAIDKPSLYGGEGREGGVVGTVDACFGGPAQGRNSYLQAVLGSAIPAFRGLFALVARKCYLAGNNPYLKSWSVMAQRTRIGWEDALADIASPDGYIDMNPAHIILEALTNSIWGGLGYPISDIDTDSFRTAAITLAAEKFGLSLLWAKNTSAEEFIQIILNHIDAVLFFSHVTGKVKLKLVRNDYNIGVLTVLNESNILELISYSTPNDTEVINQVTINYVDRENTTQAITIHDIAGIARMNGQTNGKTIELVGIAHADLATRLAGRELQQLAVPISSMSCIVNRTVSHIEPGDCINFSFGSIGFQDVVMRVTEVEYDAHSDQRLRITAVRDVYGIGAVSFVTPTGSMWVSPTNEPQDVANIRLQEMTWWQFVRQFGESQAVLDELTDTATMVTAVCTKPTQDALNFELWTKNAGASEWLYMDTDDFAFSTTVAGDVVPEIQSTIVLANPIDIELAAAGRYAFLGTSSGDNEIVAVVSTDLILNSVTVNRGVMDTIPETHSAGTRIWFCDEYFATDDTERIVGETVEVRMLPSTMLGKLDIANAATASITCQGRMMRPYPPGNVQINGQRWPSQIAADAALTVSWAHRSRTAQTVSLNRQDEGNIGPEAGVTYTLRIYGDADNLLRTVTGLTGTSYTYALVDETADSAFAVKHIHRRLRIELESVRGSLTSLKKWNLEVIRPLPPINLTQPIITGTPAVGENLTVTDGTWEYLS